MIIRFSTEAANADILGEDTPTEGLPEAAVGASPSRRSEPALRERGGATDRREAKPGQDINAPGFLRERDTSKPT